MRKILKVLYKLIHKSKENGSVTIIGTNIEPVTVCEIVNGKPKVTRNDYVDIIEFVLRYSPFRKVVKWYDKKTLNEIR